MPDSIDRREFVAAATGALGLSAAPLLNPGLAPGVSLEPFGFAPLDPVRVAFVGVGHQGTSHVENFLKLEGVEIRRFDGQNWEEAHAASRGPAVP